MKSPAGTTSPGFTFVALIVVVALLAAIMLPALAKARQ
jgi:Tfp pilus assembly protein PilE